MSRHSRDDRRARQQRREDPSRRSPMPATLRWQAASSSAGSWRPSFWWPAQARSTWVAVVGTDPRSGLRMKFALYGLHRGSSVDPEQLRARAVRAEEAGFEGLWVGDHIALPSSAPDSATEPRLEALTALAFLAAASPPVCLGV